MTTKWTPEQKERYKILVEQCIVPWSVDPNFVQKGFEELIELHRIEFGDGIFEDLWYATRRG